MAGFLPLLLLCTSVYVAAAGRRCKLPATFNASYILPWLLLTVLFSLPSYL